MAKTTIKSLERRIKNMSTPKRRKKRRVTRKRSTALSAPKRRTRRRRKGFLHDKGAIMSSVKANGAGAVGGVLFAGIEKLPLKPWLKFAAGFGGAILVSSFANSPNVAAGLSGATAYSAAKTFFPSFLGDNLEDVSYVDPNTLSDSGYVDGQGNAIVQDTEGVMYALNDGGDLEAIGDAYSLQDGMQSVAMLPLSNDFALNDRFDI